jgi:hypothetical protein
MAVILLELIHLQMPWYAPFYAAIKEADAAGTPVPACARSLAEALPYLGYVVAQEALELCSSGRPEQYRNNPVHQLLLSSPCFR